LTSLGSLPPLAASFAMAERQMIHVAQILALLIGSVAVS